MDGAGLAHGDHLKTCKGTAHKFRSDKVNQVAINDFVAGWHYSTARVDMEALDRTYPPRGSILGIY